jgi:mono/diheme cytochrome c family protein
VSSPRRRCTLPVGAAALAVVALGAACGEPKPTPAALYATHCARCHGADGRGDVRSRGLFPGLDLTTAEPVRLGARGVLYRRISQGYGAMPAFSHRLDQDQIGELVDFTLQFSAAKRGR